MNTAGKTIGGNGGTTPKDHRQNQERRDGRGEGGKNDAERRRSLPVLANPAEDLDPPLSSSEGRECLSLGNSPRPTDDATPQGRSNGKSTRGAGRAIRTLPRRPTLVRHESLPSLHLNARCIKCDRVGTIYCKGCEAHFCAKHDRIRHRFTLRKNRHQHEALPGISYFRIPLPVDGVSGSDSIRSGNSGSDFDDLDTRSSSDTNSTNNSNEKWKLAAPREKRLQGADAGRARQRGEELSMRSRGGMQGGRAAGRDGRSGGVQSEEENSRRRRRSSASSTASAPAAASASASARGLSRRGWYDKIVMAIVRPPRCKYTQEDLGPSVVPLHSGLAMKRRDFEVRNRRGLKLVCSQWRPAFAEDTSQLPCVVYLHGNSSARVDVVKTRSLTVLSAALCTVVSFDFSGSGMSEGDWVTLGYFEQHDVADVLAYLRSNGMASRYLLWGRSMGAASAMLYAACYPNSDLCGLILDSPFSSFRRLARDLVTGGQIHVPGFLVNGALALLRRSVKKRTRCDLKTLAPIARASSIRCPCLFIAARKDVMVRPHHGAELSEAVGGASLFVTCRGSHNSSRPGVVLQAIATFVKGSFRAPDVPISQALVTIQEALADAQESAKARRDGHNVKVGGSGASGLAPGSGHGPKEASALADGEGKGEGLDGAQRLSISQGSRRGGREMRGKEVRRTSSFDGREASAASASLASGAAADANGSKFRQPRRSKSQNAGDSDADRQRRGSARSSNTSSAGGGSDSVVEVGDIEANEVDGIAAEAYDDGDVNVENGISGRYGQPLSYAALADAAPTVASGRVRRAGRGIRGVFPGKALHEGDYRPRCDPYPHRRLEEKPSDSKLRGFGGGGGDNLQPPFVVVSGTMRALYSPPPPASIREARESDDMEASGRSAVVDSALLVEGEGRQAKKRSLRESAEMAAKGVDGQVGHRPHPRVTWSGHGGAVAGADTVTGSVTTVKHVLGGSSDRSRDQPRGSVGNGNAYGGGPMISDRVDVRAAASVAAPGVEGAPTASRRRSNTEQTRGGSGGNAGGWWGRVRLKTPGIRALGRRGRGGGKGGRGEGRIRNGNEALSSFPNMRLKRASLHVCNTCGNPNTSCLCETRSGAGVGAGGRAGGNKPYVLRTVSGKLKM